MRIIRTLHEGDADAYARLRRQSLEELPLVFGASAATDVASAVSAESILIGAFEDEQLIAAIGLYRGAREKSAHKMQVWGMYVAPEFRGRGIAPSLLEAALRQARETPGVDWVDLSVTSAAPVARKLYERAGFQLWGTEPDALRHEGESVDEYHLTLRLR